MLTMFCLAYVYIKSSLSHNSMTILQELLFLYNQLTDVCQK